MQLDGDYFKCMVSDPGIHMELSLIIASFTRKALLGLDLFLGEEGKESTVWATDLREGFCHKTMRQSLGQLKNY